MPLQRWRKEGTPCMEWINKSCMILGIHKCHCAFIGTSCVVFVFIIYPSLKILSPCRCCPTPSPILLQGKDSTRWTEPLWRQGWRWVKCSWRQGKKKKKKTCSGVNDALLVMSESATSQLLTAQGQGGCARVQGLHNYRWGFRSRLWIDTAQAMG